MNLSPKTIGLFVFLMASMFAWNGFLIVRDNNMFEAMDSRNAELCKLDQSYCKE
jgi:hypothetical protein